MRGSGRGLTAAVGDPAGGLVCGAASSSAEFGSWREAFGGRLTVRMQFVAWTREVDPAALFEGPGVPMISWEPWRPPPPGTTSQAQGEPQPEYSNASIAAGDHDDYVDRWATAAAAYAQPVLLRPMHEFNGSWYPWSHDPEAFIAAWKHLRSRFDACGAGNVIWVWSAQPGGGEGRRRWSNRVREYWPGADTVDVLGMSMVRFLSGANDVRGYFDFLRSANRRFGRPTMITEANVAHALRERWLPELHRSLERARGYNQGFVFSQLPSREQARNPSAGEMNWDARSDPDASQWLRRIAMIGAT